ncbi:MAG: peptidoglycan editing factor PgeF [Actinomycetaceae bacterium]|nr:peptidoglycan editing factor PgeF [Actinomycetaceae bacterium]
MFRLGGARAVFTNRTGGVSQAPYNSLNVGFHVGDDRQHVIENHRRINEAIGHDVVWMKQTHSNRVTMLQPGHTDGPISADGLVMDARAFYKLGLTLPALGVMVADCVPLLLGSKNGHVVAAVHAGRSGIVTGIVREALFLLRQHGIAASQLHAAIGPSICGKCYEVSHELHQFVTSHVPAAWSRTRWGSPGLDLRSAVVSQLQVAGVTVSFISKRCTYEDHNLYSYRRDTTTGRFAGIALATQPLQENG